MIDRCDAALVMDFTHEIASCLALFAVVSLQPCIFATFKYANQSANALEESFYEGLVGSTTDAVSLAVRSPCHTRGIGSGLRGRVWFTDEFSAGARRLLKPAKKQLDPPLRNHDGEHTLGT